MRTIPWQPGFTWRKLGYLSYSSSLNYREIVELNPEWNVTIEPAIGTVIRYESPTPNTGLLGTNITLQPTSSQATPFIYPFTSVYDYVESIARYSPSALMTVDRVNGWSIDTQEALTGSEG